MDPEEGDFRLRPESPAYKLGFLPINTEFMGIRRPDDGQGIDEDSHYLRAIRQVAGVEQRGH